MFKNQIDYAGPASEELKKQQAIQVLQFAQITKDYQQVVKRIACNLYDDVANIFPDHLQMIYLLTNDRRRQVWHAVIASEIMQDTLKTGGKAVVKLRHDLLATKSTQLLKAAFNDLPNSFEALLSRFGTQAQDREVYLMLYDIARIGGPTLRRQMLGGEELQARTIRHLHALPADLRNVGFANSLKDQQSVKDFVRLMNEMQLAKFQDKADVEEKLLIAIKNNKNVPAAIKEIYIRLPFPPQIVPDTERLRYITCGLELEKVAKEFNNCLGNFVPIALRGEKQFYVWSKDLVVSIHKYRGHWQVDEIKLKGNREPTVKLQKTIINHFAKNGVQKINGFASMLEPFLLEDAFNFGGVEPNIDDMEFDFSYFAQVA